MKSDNAARVSASVAVVPVSRKRRQADANDGSAVGRAVSTATHRRGFRRGLGRLACDMSGRASWCRVGPTAPRFPRWLAGPGKKASAGVRFPASWLGHSRGSLGRRKEGV